MSTYEDEHPKKGAENRTVDISGAYMSDVSDTGRKKHPLESRCDLLNQTGGNRVPEGAITLLAIVALAFIALHLAGIEDSISLHLMGAFFTVIKPERH